MKIPRLNPYYRASLLLIVASSLLIAIAILTDRHDLTSAALVISSLACLITGIFVATLSTAEPLETAYVSLLAAPGTISLCRIAADLGIQGTAYLLPTRLTGRNNPVQFNPVSSFAALPRLDGESIIFQNDATGMVTDPPGLLLYARLKQEEQLVLPADRADIPPLLREVLADALEIADTVSVEENDDVITISLTGYRLSAGCRAVERESPRCCSMQPCPVVSLVSCIIAETSGRVVAMERCGYTEDDDRVTAVCTLLPLPDREPEVQVPVAGIDTGHSLDTR